MSATEKCPICTRARYAPIQRRVPYDHECLTKVAPTCEPQLARMRDLLKRSSVAISDLLNERELGEPTDVVGTYSHGVLSELEDLLG